jgi:hypothetical protein
LGRNFKQVATVKLYLFFATEKRPPEKAASYHLTNALFA